VEKAMQKILRSLLRTYKSEGEVSGFLSLDRIKRAMATNLSVKEERPYVAAPKPGLVLLEHTSNTL